MPAPECLGRGPGEASEVAAQMGLVREAMVGRQLRQGEFGIGETLVSQHRVESMQQ